MTTNIKIPINPGRVLFGLSRIGYTPESAICDIVDNAVSARAKNINILIKRTEQIGDARRNNVSEYIIIDDGDGMDEQGILKALTLGAPSDYEANSLSKFGLGLKSAAFSQGDALEVISSKNSVFHKYRVSLPEIKDSYFASKLDISEEDTELIEKYLPNKKGTIIRIGAVRKEGHPAVRATIKQLKDRIGVIYYYFLVDGALSIRLEENVLPAVDILFTSEADRNGNLDDATWDGVHTQWLQRPKVITLDAEAQVQGTIEVTQLPHPPSFLLIERGGDKIAREKYFITAQNYGYYVYRNKRLISWADSLDGIIGEDQDLWSFRGRILIDDTADDVFNIDVKKLNIKLSEEARDVVFDLSKEYKRNSIKAWNRAKNLKKELENEEPNQQSNSLIEQLIIPDSLPGQPILSPDEDAKVEKGLTDRMKASIRQQIDQTTDIAASTIIDNGEAVNVKSKTDEEIFEETLKGETNPYATKIFRVPSLPDNQLWEPYYDAEHEYCVRINRYHRFAKLLFEENSRNPDIQVLFEVFLHQMAVAEVQFRRQFQGLFPKLNLNDERVEQLTSEFRRYVAGQLAFMCGRLDDKLPRTE